MNTNSYIGKRTMRGCDVNEGRIPQRAEDERTKETCKGTLLYHVVSLYDVVIMILL